MGGRAPVVAGCKGRGSRVSTSSQWKEHTQRHSGWYTQEETMTVAYKRWGDEELKQQAYRALFAMLRSSGWIL